jgi:hypothetical protein
MKIARRWIPLLIVLAATAVLAFVIRDFVRQVIVLPLVYVGWFGWIVLTNLPFWIFWAVLLLVMVAIAGASLRRPERYRRPAPPPDALPQGPVTTWYKLLDQAERSTTAQRRLARGLGQVLWRVRYPDLPYNEALFLQHADDAALALPPEMRAYFHAGLQRDTPAVPRRLRRLDRHRVQGTDQHRDPHDALDLPPSEAVTFLEDELNPGNLE